MRQHMVPCCCHGLHGRLWDSLDQDGRAGGHGLHDPSSVGHRQPDAAVGTRADTQHIGLLLDVAALGIGGNRMEEEDPVVQKAGVVAGVHTLAGIVEVVAALGLDAEAAPGRGVIHARRGIHGVEQFRPVAHIDPLVLKTDLQGETRMGCRIRVINLLGRLEPINRMSGSSSRVWLLLLCLILCGR